MQQRMESHPLRSTFLWRSLFFERPSWKLLVLLLSLVAAVFGILAPYSQKHFVDDLLAGHPSQFWIWAAFFLTLGAQALAQASVWLALRESFISQKAMGDHLFARLLAGPGGVVGRQPAGVAVSLFAVDIPGAASILDQSLVTASSMIFPLILAPVALQILFGIPWWPCALVILGLTLFNYLMARRQSRFFYNFKQLGAERTGLVAEWIQNIRALRILRWVETLEKRMVSVRKRETVNRKSMVTNGQIINSVASSTAYLLNILAVVFLLQIRGSLPTPGELFGLLWIMGVFLARPLRQLPWTFVIAMDAFTSMRRLESALAIPLAVPSVEEPLSTSAPAPGLALEVRGLQLKADGQELLKEVDLFLKPGQLVAVVGEVGSGKSLLLQSIMGATQAQFARFAFQGRPTEGPLDPFVHGRIAFVPQEGFTMSASLRENVMLTYLDQPPDLEVDARALRSLQLAQFYPERERLAEGLDTEIGERGVNLSGGQRQRISLARAHFADRELVLLDDCLSAVDVDTERKLIEELICGAWARRTRLLVTHRMAILPLCDQLLFMDNGRILLRGTYGELLGSSARFRDFVKREEVRVTKGGGDAGA